MSAVPHLHVVDDSLNRHAAREARIDAHDSGGITLRIESGRDLLMEREANGGRQLPRGRLDEICAAVGKPRSAFERELQWRMAAARRYRTAAEVRTAVRKFESWTALRNSLISEAAERKKRAREMSEQFDAIRRVRPEMDYRDVRAGVPRPMSPELTSPEWRVYLFLRQVEYMIRAFKTLPPGAETQSQILQERFTEARPEVLRIAHLSLFVARP